MSDKYYNIETINSMNCSNLWRNCITVQKDYRIEDKFKLEKNDSKMFELHATGYADLDGRKYVALPKGTNIKDPEIKKKYNLI